MTYGLKFQLTRPAGGEPLDKALFLFPQKFQLTRPAGGEPGVLPLLDNGNTCFNSLAPRGANPDACVFTSRRRTFQLTRPAGGEPYLYKGNVIVRKVSTHSPRGGRTSNPAAFEWAEWSFNSLAPRGANHNCSCRAADFLAFQLTRPAGGEPFRVNS